MGGCQGCIGDDLTSCRSVVCCGAVRAPRPRLSHRTAGHGRAQCDRHRRRRARVRFSDGTRHPVPRHLRQAQQQLRRAQQDLSRKERGSSNRAKARQRVARLHARVADRRADWLHKLTTSIVDRHDTIVIEDLNVRSMTGNRRLALSIADASFGQFRQMLTYKTQTRRRTLLLADRWFPSTRLCSVCGAKTKHRLPLHIRAWTCDTCRTSHDRDLNAARNLAAYDPAVSSTVAACGALLTTDETKPSSDLSSHRHEPGTRHYDELQLV